MSGSAFEFYSSNTEIAYPFDDRLPNGLHRLFVDAYVVYSRTGPGRIRLTSFDPSGSCTLLFEDNSLLASLTSADGFTTQTWGKFTVYEWHRSSVVGPGFTGEDIIVRFVVLTDKLVLFSFPVSLQGFLLASLTENKPLRVRRLGVAIPDLACCAGGGIVENKTVLESGFNIKLSLAGGTQVPVIKFNNQVTPRSPTVINIDCIPGAGKGRFPTCTSLAPDLKLINKEGPDNAGNFSLEGRDCTWLERRIAPGVQPPIHPFTNYLGTILNSLLQLHNSCKACCDCLDYFGSYSQIRVIFERAQVAAAKIESLRVQHNQLCVQIGQAKTQREDGLHGKLELLTFPDYHVSILGIVYNNKVLNSGPLTLSFKISWPTLVYIAGSGYLEAEKAHNVPLDPTVVNQTTYTVQLPNIRPGHYAVYSFAVRATGSSRKGKTVSVVMSMSGSLLQETGDSKAVGLIPPLVNT